MQKIPGWSVGSSNAPPLDGITVLDLTRVLSGPYCTMLLADMGARVIKIEQPDKGDDTRAWGPPFVNGESVYFLSINRNKESVTLDFKTPEGRGLLDRLIAKADVVVENFRPGVLKKLGLDYETLAATHPRLIHCSISGFGQTGPRSQEPGYDAVIQAEGGLMSLTGAGDGPPYRVGIAVADVVSGLFAAQGVVLALDHRAHLLCRAVVGVVVTGRCSPTRRGSSSPPTKRRTASAIVTRLSSPTRPSGRRTPICSSPSATTACSGSSVRPSVSSHWAAMRALRPTRIASRGIRS